MQIDEINSEDTRAPQTACATARLSIVAYHYVRDLPRSRFPKIKGLSVDGFVRQVKWLEERYEIATLESALDFLEGRYQPRRDLCLLTFDDGLKEHYTEVLPILHDHGIQGVFLLTTACLGGWVASVHKNHFLMASIEFERYQRAVQELLAERFFISAMDVDRDVAQQTHRFDSPEVAQFKYLLNYQLPIDIRNAVLDQLFAEFLGDDHTFARELYLDWNDALEMQAANMSLGGHSHSHRALTTLAPDQRWEDLAACAGLLRSRLNEQALWPFSYPHGDTDDLTKDMLRKLNFACGFTVRIGPKQIEHRDLFGVQRIDTTEVAAS